MLFCFFNDSAPTESYTYLHTLSLHDALPIYVVVVDPPVGLAAPEIVVAVGVPGLDRYDVLRVAVAVFIHAEEEQPVLDDGAGRPDGGVGDRAVVATPAIALVDGAVPVELVIPCRCPGRRLQGDLGARMEFVAARARHGVDDTTGAAAEDRKSTRLNSSH